uniref:Uncharacterized protein n=1 Tax=Opuntia streptacantha TaxID=393608 RepID=A0A7C9EUP4_OPUST
MTKDDPVNTQIDKHLCAHFTSKGTTLAYPAILRSHVEVRPQQAFYKGKKHKWRADHNLHFIFRRNFSSIQYRYKLLHFLSGSIAFPIAADEEFPGHCFAEGGEREREAVEVVDARKCLWLCAFSVYVEVVL